MILINAGNHLFPPLTDPVSEPEPEPEPEPESVPEPEPEPEPVNYRLIQLNLRNGNEPHSLRNMLDMISDLLNNSESINNDNLVDMISGYLNNQDTMTKQSPNPNIQIGLSFYRIAEFNH